MNFSKYTYDSSRSDQINHLRNPASKLNINGPHLGRALRKITATLLLLLIPLSLAHSNNVLNGPVRFYNYGESYPIRLLLIESKGVEVKNGYNFQIDPENSVTREVNLFDKFRIFRVNRGTGSGADIDLSLSSSEAYITRTLTIDTLSPAQGEYRIFTSGTFGEDADVRSNPDHAAASIVSAYYGYDVREHNPLDFSAARRSLVFEGLSNANTAWDTVETALPVGCSYLTRNSGELKTSSTKEHFTKESYQESWGFNVGGTFPLPKPGLSASASLGVNQTESEQTSTREVFISKHYLKEAYIGHCNPYNPKEDGELRKFGKPFPNLHSAFNNDIINLDPNSESDADRFINEYGTHYPGSILYGGFSSFVLTLSEENYEKAKRLGVDFSAAINNAGSAGTPVEKNLTQTHDNVQYSTKSLTTEGKKPPSSGEVGFQYSKNENFQETLNQSRSRWISIGTEPGHSFDNVVSTNKSAVPIQMDWVSLDKLIHVDLVDSDLTLNELNARKDAISAAIDRAISEATQRALKSSTKPEKGYKFRVTGIDIAVIRDETDPGLSGEINICNDLSQCVTVWSACDHPDMHIGAVHKQCWLNNHVWAKDWKTEWRELVIEGKTDIDNNGTPQVTYQEPGFSSISVSGELVDFDIGGPETNDVANFTSRYQIDQLNDIETIEIAAPFFNEWKEIVANAKVTLEIVPLPLPGNQPETFDDFSNSSPPLRTAFIGESAQGRYLPPPSPTEVSTEPSNDIDGVEHKLIYLRNHWTNRYLSVDAKNDFVPIVDPYKQEQFYMEPANIPGKNGSFFTLKRAIDQNAYLGGNNFGVGYYSLATYPIYGNTLEVQDDDLRLFWKFHQSGDRIRIESVAWPGNYLHQEYGNVQLGPIQPNWASAWWWTSPSGGSAQTFTRTAFTVNPVSSGANATLTFGAEVTIENKYNNWDTYLDVEGVGTEPGSAYSVSAADDVENDRSTVWRITSPNAAQGSPIKYGDTVYVNNATNNWGSWLDVNSSGCEGNILCVSAANTTNRSGGQGTGVWKILPVSGGKTIGENVAPGDEIHLENQWSGRKTYLDTRNPGCEGNKYCVSTSESRDRAGAGTGIWRISPL